MPRMPKRRGCKIVKFGGCINAVPLGDDIDDLDFEEQATVIRERCKSERTQLMDQAKCSRRVRFHDKPINAMPEYRPSMSSEAEWQHIELAVDSGAAETVIPHDLVTDHPIEESDASREGLCYVSATGQPIPNLGEQKLPLVTNECTMRGMTFQAALVKKPLGSVKRICSCGHRVVFDEEGSYIQNKGTGEINWMREEQGNYILDLWVLPGKSEWGCGGQP